VPEDISSFWNTALSALKITHQVKWKKSLLCSGCAVKCAVDVEQITLQVSSGCTSEDCCLKETMKVSPFPRMAFTRD